MARDINNRALENIGLDQRVWVISETGGYGTDATGGLIPTATDALEHVNAKIDFTIPRDDAAHRSGRSRVTRLSGKKDVKWSYEGYIIPADPTGSNPNLPDIHPMLVTAFGSCVETDVAKKVYTLTRTSTRSFRMLEEGTHFSRLAVGCVCDTATFTLPGDGKAMLKMEGFGQDAFIAGQSTLASATVAANDVTVQTGHGGRFQVGSYTDLIQASDGSTRIAASRKITAITGDVLTLSGAVFSASTSDILIGAAPDFTGATPSSSALLGLKGSFSTTNMGTVDCDLMSAEISIKNNYTPRTNTYGKATICGFVTDKRREIAVKLDILLTKANYEFYSNNAKFTADNLTITLAPQDIPAPAVSDATGRTFKFKLPRVEFNVPSLEQPSDGYIKLSLEGVALATDINTLDTEMTLEIL